MNDELKEVRALIKEAKSIVFFGGAGVSTASGIPDFRSATGLYNRRENTNFSPEYMLSHEFLMLEPDAFSDYVKKNLFAPEAKPNGAHIALKELEDEGKLLGVITQNIDGLHQMAGSKKVLEIHGNLTDYYCMDCHKAYTKEDFLKVSGALHCNCGGVVRPDVVLYGEGLPMDVWSEAVSLIEQAEVFIVGGTSLVVYPAASLLQYYRGNKLILINQEPTPRDAYSDYVIHGDISRVLPELIK